MKNLNGSQSYTPNNDEEKKAQQLFRTKRRRKTDQIMFDKNLSSTARVVGRCLTEMAHWKTESACPSGMTISMRLGNVSLHEVPAAREELLRENHFRQTRRDNGVRDITMRDRPDLGNPFGGIAGADKDFYKFGAYRDFLRTQEKLFDRIFATDAGLNPTEQVIAYGVVKLLNVDTLTSRCADGKDNTAPREVIHLLNTVREEEAKRIQHGNALPPENRLFDRSVFKAALPAVSKARLIQTVYAEYPDVETFLSRLKGEKTEHTVDSLASLWKVSKSTALTKAEELVEIGFFQRRGSRDAPTFWVPFLYRDALEMVQGKAEE